jgi:hypothetical protein
MPALQELAPGVHELRASQRFLGLELGTRMTVLETSGGLLLHSPVSADAAVLEHLGEARWVVAPNKLHHLYAGEWLDRGLEGWAPPGLAAKRADLAWTGLLDGSPEPFGSEIAVFPLRCFPFAEEVVLLHRPSKTLVVTDLVFHLGPDAPWLTRAAFTALLGHPGCQTTVLERLAFHRAVARTELSDVLDEPWDRLVMAHGQVIDTGGKDQLRQALRWLDLPP